MKLTELIGQITGLPWPDDPCHDDAPDFLHPPNWDYARHAANVLPELVRRLKLIADEKSWMGSADMRHSAAEALKIAEEVQDNSEQRTTP